MIFTYDELELRQMTEKQLNKVERSDQFALAIFFDNNREIIQELKEEQDIAIACRMSGKNAALQRHSYPTIRNLLQKRSARV